MLEILLVIAPLFILIFLGAVLAKTGIADESWQTGLNSYALKVGFPALIFVGISKMDVPLSDYFELLIANSLFLLSCFSLALISGKLFNIKPQMIRTLFICIPFGNVAYLGIPTLMQTFGNEILPEASLITGITLFWVFTLGIGYLEFQQNKKITPLKLFKNLLKNPLLLAVLFGLLFSSLNLTLPELLQSPLEMLSTSVTPVVLLIIGLFLGHAKLGNLSKWKGPFGLSLTTLILLPMIFYGIIKLTNFNSIQLTPSLIDAAMPIAITPFALADEYKLDQAFIARSIVLSTILSIVSLPFWISIL
jgi:predicted permease